MARRRRVGARRRRGVPRTGGLDWKKVGAMFKNAGKKLWNTIRSNPTRALNTAIAGVNAVRNAYNNATTSGYYRRGRTGGGLGRRRRGGRRRRTNGSFRAMANQKR